MSRRRATLAGLASTSRRRATLARLVTAAVLAVVALLAPATPALAAGSPNVSLVITTPTNVLYGSSAPVTFITTNPAGTDGYNLSYRAILPLGVSYVAGSAGAAAGEPTILTGTPASGQTTLLWKNLTDLEPSTSHTLAFKVLPSTATFGVSGTFAILGGAYLNSNPDRAPAFTSGGVADSSTYTGSSEITTATAANSSKIAAVTVSEDSTSAPSGALLRGVHKNQAIYTITVANNSIGPTNTTTVDEYLPPGLEFLGCGGANADHTTNAPTNLGGKAEYPGSGLITVPAVSGCSAPNVVETNTFDPIGPGPSALYTHVQWAIGDLAAGQTKTISYAAAIPLRANTATWSGTAPTAASGNQAANLDNNSGAEVVDDTTLTNYVNARGFFNGSALVSTDASLTRTAEDLAIAKHAQTSTLAQGGTTQWDLTLTTSEYRDASSAVVTDTLPNGLCPLQNGVQLTHGAPSAEDSAECLSSSESPTMPYTSATENADGTWQLTWDSSTDPALAQLAPNATHTITFPTRTRSSYQSSYEDVRPITAGDVLKNTVGVTASGRLACANDAACAPGPAPGTQIGNGLTFAMAVADNASDTLSAGGPTLGISVASTSSDCSTASYVDSPIPSYSPGDRICWQLHVDYPAGLSTQQATLTDFLPTPLTFDTSFASGGDQATANDTLGSGVALDSSTATPGPGGALRWSWPSNYVAGGSVFEHRVATTVGLPSGAQAGDITPNLFKAGNDNAAGTSVPARDTASYRLAMPVMTATKQIIAVNGHSQAGTSTQVVHGGDTVTYRLQLANASTDTAAQNIEAWDRLPTGVTCSDVTASGNPISNGGACTSNVIQWGASPAVGPDVAAGSTVDLTYSIVIPAATQPTQALTSTGGIRQFHTTTNTGGAFFYYPSSNIDPSAEPSANVSPASSSATLTGAEPTITQTRTTSLNESNGAVDYNTDQTATIGETIHHTVTATIPAGETIRDFTVTNPLDASTPAREQLQAASLTQTSGPTGAPVSLTSSGNTVTLSLGSSYTAASGADTVFTFAFDGVVSDVAANYRTGAILSNAATMTYTPPGATAPTSTTAVTSPLQTAIVEPVITVDNQVTPGGAISPGQTLTFQILARNGTGAASPAHDTQLVDTVAAGITPINDAGNPINDGEYTQGGATGGGGLWSASARTLTFASLATLNPGDADVHTFKATVDSPVTGGVPLTSTVVATTTSLPGVVTGERTSASTPRNTGYTDSKPLTLNAAGPTVAISPGTSTPLTPAQQQTYTVTVTIPANTKLYDVYIGATLPDSMVFDSHGFDQCTSGCVGTGATPPFNKYDVVSGNANTQLVGWDLGDITQTAPAPRVISLPFTAHLLATKRGSGSPGTPVVATNTGTVPVVASSNRTNRNTAPFASASPPTISYVFDDTSAPAAAQFNVVEPNLKVDKTVAVNNFNYVDGPLTVHDGDTLRYKITITNTGDQPAYDITIKDTPDARITNVQMSAGLSSTANTLANGGHPWTGPGDYMMWSVGSAGLAKGASVSVDYTASLPAVTTMHQGTTFLNTANLQHAYGLPGTTRAAHGGTAFVYRDYNVVNYAALADATTVKYDHPSLSINKTTGVAPSYPDTAQAQIDHPFTWRVVVTNTSATAPATKLTVTDTLPPDWTFEPNSAAFSNGTTSQPTITPSASGDQLVWATNNGLAAGASTTLTYQARPTYAAITHGTGAAHPHVNTANASVLDAVGAPADADGPFVPAAPDTAQATIDLPSLQIAATPDGGAAHAGETLPFHVKVSNTGPVEATSLVVTDTLPLGTTYTAGSATASPATGFTETSYVPEVPASGGNPAVPGTVTWKVAQLSASPASVDITVPIATDPASASGTVVTNAASVTSAQTPAVSDSATVTLTPSADLQAAITAQVPGPPPATVSAATAGSQLQYVIGATNKGPSVATTIVLKDQLPSTVTLVSAPSQCTSGPTTPATTPATVTVTCTFTGATGVSDSVSATILTAINSGVTTNANDSATATSATTDPVGSNNSASVAIPVGALADLTLHAAIVGASPDPTVGSVVDTRPVQFTLTAHNAGPSDATGVSIEDTLPAGLQFVSASTGCVLAGQKVTCTIGGMATGTDASVSITTKAIAVGAQLSAAVVKSAVDPDTTNNDAATTVTVEPATDLALALTAPPTVPAVDDATYALIATNDGPDDATGATITQQLPAGTTFASGDPGCTAVDVTVTCVVGAIAAHGSATVHVVAHVPVELGATAITSNASIAGAETDLDSSNNAASGSTQVGPVADISITQTGPDSIVAGGTYTFTLSVHNDGPSDAPDVDVTDTLPDGVTPHLLTQSRSGQAAGRSATPSQGTCAEASGTATCHLGTLAAGGSTLITVAVDVPETFGDGTLTNVASAKSSIPDPRANNASASFSTHVTAKPIPTPAPVVAPTPDPVLPPGSADLSITKNAEGVARANRELRYQIVATNKGPATADNVTVDDALVGGVQYRAYQSGDGRCAFSGGTLHCKLGSLKAGELTVVHVTVVPSKTGELVNNATIASDTNDPVTGNNRAVALNAVSALPPTKLSVATTSTAKRVRGGARITFALKVRNMGSHPASNMQVCDRLPAQLAFTSTTGGVLNGSRLCFTQKLLAAGKRAVFKVKVRVAARARKGFIVNRAFADAENAATQNASVRSQVITDGKVSPAAVHGFTG